MKANMNLMEPGEETEHGAVRLRFNISKQLHDKDKKKTDRETVYRWMALLFASITFLGIAYLFGISDVFSSGKQAERKDYKAEELLNAQTIKKEQEKLSEEQTGLYVNDAASKDEANEETNEGTREGEEVNAAETAVVSVTNEEEEPIGEEF